MGLVNSCIPSFLILNRVTDCGGELWFKDDDNRSVNNFFEVLDNGFFEKRMCNMRDLKFNVSLNRETYSVFYSPECDGSSTAR